MKNRLYVNWLLVITVLLLITSVIALVLSSSKGDNTFYCSYDGVRYLSGSVINVDGKEGCYCNDNGNIVCNGSGSSVNNSEFSSRNLSFNSRYTTLVTSESYIDNVKFVDISQKGEVLKVILERKSFCNEDGLPAPQIGLYKMGSEELVLRVTTNLTNTDFNLDCVVENTFEISGIVNDFDSNYSVVYQDEFANIFNAGNCVYEGRLRNDGDVYQSIDKCFLCTCKSGLNSCESEDICLD